MGFFMGRDKDSEDIKDINGSVSAASVFRDDQQTDQQADQGTDQEADKDVNQFREDGFSDSADAADAAGEEPDDHGSCIWKKSTAPAMKIFSYFILAEEKKQ